jgi:hypothetical protein
MLAARGAPGQALSWVERGIELDSTASHSSFSGHGLAALKPRLLKELGRDREVVSLVRGRHHRKTGFMPDFEAMVEGLGGRCRAVVSGAKARWGRPAGPLS